MITLAPHHPLLPNNNFGIESVTKNSEITSSSSTSNESNVNPFDPLSWQSFVANASKRTIESIDFTNGTELNLDEEVTTVSTWWNLPWIWWWNEWKSVSPSAWNVFKFLILLFLLIHTVKCTKAQSSIEHSNWQTEKRWTKVKRTLHHMSSQVYRWFDLFYFGWN